ncbi:MAG: hypothetical protein SPE43_03850 [Ruminococcus sp.]|nr:hypothetical protein [Ruminococcus sp.]
MCIEDIKKLFSDSEKVVMIFIKDELIWSNREAEFFGGQFPAYCEFEKEETKKSKCRVRFSNDDITLAGEMHRDGQYSFILFDKKDILAEAFEDIYFQKYIESNNLYIKASISEISAYVTLMRSEAEKNGRTDFQEYYDGIDSSCMGIMKTVQNNEIMKSTSKDYSNTNSFLNIKNIIDEICMNIVCSCQNKIKIKNNIRNAKMYSDCDENLLKLLFLHVLRYVIFSSYSTEINISSSLPEENSAEITVICSKKEKNSNLTMDFYDKMINFNMDELLIRRLSESLGVTVEKKDFDKKISMSMKFRLCEPTGLKAPKKPERHTKFSPANITFFDFVG